MEKKLISGLVEITERFLTEQSHTINTPLVKKSKLESKRLLGCPLGWIPEYSITESLGEEVFLSE